MIPTNFVDTPVTSIEKVKFIHRKCDVNLERLLLWHLRRRRDTYIQLDSELTLKWLILLLTFGLSWDTL